MNNIFSLKNFGFSLGITNFSFIFCLKVIFFIIFIILNICLIYTEYLDRKYTNIKNPESHLKSGLTPELQRIAKKVIVGIGLLSGLITIKNEYKNKQDLEEIKAVRLQKERALSDVKKGIDRAESYSNDLSKESDGDDNKTLSKENEENEDDVKKSTFFGLDEIWDEIWSRFETFDGFTKTACIMMLSSSFIISGLFSISINLYGNYILDRFKLEEKYPKWATIIKIRRNVSKYYIM